MGYKEDSVEGHELVGCVVFIPESLTLAEPCLLPNC